ncbi:MAG: STAS domain-containing protein [Egibacteraceae bacterium]
MAFHAEVRQSGDVAILDLAGDLNATAAETMDAAYQRATADRSGPLLLNFSSVGYINSTGIALVVGLLAQARREARAVRTVGLSDHYQHIFEITRLSDFMDFYPDEAAAVAGVAPASA